MYNQLVKAARKFLAYKRLKKHWRQMPLRIEEMRNKDKIKVVFVLYDLSMWKTEELYLKMLSNPRFSVEICVALMVCDTPFHAIEKYNTLIKYLNDHTYHFVEEPYIRNLKPDITFYQQPYDGVCNDQLFWRNNPGLIYHINYGLNTGSKIKKIYNNDFFNYCAGFFVENSFIKNDFSKTLDNKGINVFPTGVPIFDSHNKFDMAQGENVWNCSNEKKRIIWAPHFSYRDGLTPSNLSSFLSLAEPMLELARKYQDKIHIIFKPHPLLLRSLSIDWGASRAQEYFDKWKSGENTQLEESAYMPIFYGSDAMIFDSSSFLIEYLFTSKPALYTIRDNSTLKSYNDFANEAYRCYYHGNTYNDIEGFILNVINNYDPMYEARQTFKKKYLHENGDQNICDNIIHTILGE